MLIPISADLFQRRNQFVELLHSQRVSDPPITRMPYHETSPVVDLVVESSPRRFIRDVVHTLYGHGLHRMGRRKFLSKHPQAIDVLRQLLRRDSAGRFWMRQFDLMRSIGHLVDCSFQNIGHVVLHPVDDDQAGILP